MKQCPDQMGERSQEHNTQVPGRAQLPDQDKVRGRAKVAETDEIGISDNVALVNLLQHPPLQRIHQLCAAGPGETLSHIACHFVVLWYK